MLLSHAHQAGCLIGAKIFILCSERAESGHKQEGARKDAIAGSSAPDGVHRRDRWLLRAPPNVVSATADHTSSCHQHKEVPWQQGGSVRCR